MPLLSDRVEEDKHFLKLKENALRAVQAGVPEDFRDPMKFTSRLILWTELGAARHAKC